MIDDLDQHLLEAQDDLNMTICRYNDAVKALHEAFEAFERRMAEASEYLVEQGLDVELEDVQLDLPEELEEISLDIPSFDAE